MKGTADSCPGGRKRKPEDKGQGGFEGDLGSVSGEARKRTFVKKRRKGKGSRRYRGSSPYGRGHTTKTKQKDHES